MSVAVPKARAAVVAAARSLFARYGIAKTTVEEIAREAGLSKATVYNYFGGKEHIIVGVVETERRLLLEKLSRAVEAAPGAVEALLSFFRTRVKEVQRVHVAYRPEEEDIVRFMPHVCRCIDSHRREEQVIIEGILRRGIEDGTFRPVEDTAMAADILFTSALGIIFPLFGKPLRSAGRRLEVFLHMTMTGLCSAKGRKKLSQGEKA